MYAKLIVKLVFIKASPYLSNYLQYMFLQTIKVVLPIWLAVFTEIATDTVLKKL